jgi:hypothetical protein
VETRRLAWRRRTVGASRADLTRLELRPGLLGESCRLCGRLAQSPSGGLWHVSGFAKAHVADVADGLLELWVLASRCCRYLARRCLHVDLRMGRMQLALAAGVHLYQHWRSRTQRTVHLSLHLEVVHPRRRPRPLDLGSQTLLLDSLGRWLCGRSRTRGGLETAPGSSGGDEPQ